MPIIAPPALTTPPNTPDRTDRATFSARAVALDEYRKNVHTPEMAAIAANVFNNATEAFDAAADAAISDAQAATSATNAANSATAADASKTAAQTAATAAGAAAGLPALVNNSFLQVNASGVLSWLAKSAETFWLAATNGLAKALRYTFVDKGTIAAAGSVTVTVGDGETQRVQAAGAITINLTGWGASGSRSELELQLVNFGGKAFTLTNPGGAVRYIIAGGGFTTVAGSNGITYQTTGTDYMLLWTDDGGTTVYAKVLR